MDYKCNVPEGESGIWSVKKFVVSEEESKWNSLRSMINHSGRFVPEGTYTKLIRNNTIVMTDTPDEIRDLRFAIYKAKGHVLVNGLGLGIFVDLILKKPEVEKVTVIEISQDVINLVGTYLNELYGDRLEIIHSDAFEYKPPKNIRYNAVWHDIWDDICSDNLKYMTKLHRKYCRKSDWQGSWAKELCR